MCVERDRTLLHNWSMTTTHTMVIVSFLFLVGMIPSITIVSGRVDLRAFGRNDGLVPYVFNCLRGRCGSLSVTYDPQSSGIRDLDRFDGVDDMVGEAGMKPYGGNSYDDNEDKTVGRFRAFKDDRWKMTFPYCSTLTTEECRSLLRRLERLRNLRQRKKGIKRNVVVTRVDGTVVRLLGRRRRSAQVVDTGNEKAAKAPQMRAARSPNGYVSYEATNRLLDQYREWRKEHGYGRKNARWGRSSLPTDHEEDGTAHQHSGNVSSDKDSLTTQNNSTANHVDILRRTPRSIVVEIEPEDELPVNERDMLDTYLAWRETHGYGTLAGRWGWQCYWLCYLPIKR